VKSRRACNPATIGEWIEHRYAHALTACRHKLKKAKANREIKGSSRSFEGKVGNDTTSVYLFWCRLKREGNVKKEGKLMRAVLAKREKQRLHMELQLKAAKVCISTRYAKHYCRQVAGQKGRGGGTGRPAKEN